MGGTEDAQAASTSPAPNAPTQLKDGGVASVLPIGADGKPLVISRSGYQGFGSFFNEVSVQDMIAVPRDAYVPPARPFAPPSLERAASLPFGEACRELFMIDFDRWTFINHGAFGGVCRPAHEEANQWREHCEAQPLKFLDRELFPQLVRVMREMADFMGADPRDLVFVPNATTGLNVAIQAAGLRPGDTMYMLNIGYGSVKKMAQAASAAAAGRGAGSDPASTAAGTPTPTPHGEAPGGINVVYGEVVFPISGPQAIVDLVAATLPPGTKLAVFDTVTSNTALLLPVAELTALCRSRGVQVLIDGAHALGQVHLDLDRGVCGGSSGGSGGSSGSSGGDASDAAAAAAAANAAADAMAASLSIGANGDSGASASDGAGGGGGEAAAANSHQPLSVPDYFVTNCHKWLAAPRGTAVMWVRRDRQAAVRPLVVSHGSGAGFTSDFIWDGMRDYAPYLATSSALGLWRAMGPDRVRTYMRQLLQQAVELCGRRWGTDLLAPSLDMCGSMALLGLPQDLAEGPEADSADAKYVQDMLHHVYSIEVPIKSIQGRLYVRMSAHIYNALPDYRRLADAVDDLVARERAARAAKAAAGEEEAPAKKKCGG